jgi:hypothetical protein
MRTVVEIVQSFYVALDQGDLTKAGEHLADDFQSFGAAGQALTKPEKLDVVRRLQEAMPNLKHALSNIRSDGPVVKLTIQAGGRHTRPLDLSHLGMGIKDGTVPGSGRMIIFQPELYEYTIAQGKIKTERVVTPATAYNGVTGFLSALGVTA